MKQLSDEERRQLEELYRQQVSAVRTLAKLLGYPCPVMSREERRMLDAQRILKTKEV